MAIDTTTSETLRVARPTNRLADLVRMYVEGLGLSVLAEFANHDGFDGVVLGRAGDPYHLEFTSQRGHEVGGAPSKDHLLVFYVPDVREWFTRCERMINAGFLSVRSYNPYWDREGRTFEDVDGYRVVLQNADWQPTSPYEVSLARPDDLPLLAEIELAAARMLVGHAPESVLLESTASKELLDAQRLGHLWVARSASATVGFAHVMLLEPGVAHLNELDVHPEHGRRGVGTRLVRTVCRWASASGLNAVSLCTFRDVPWNMPFYARLGFVVTAPSELSPALRAVVAGEAQRGLDPANRVVMRWSCQARRTNE